MGASDNGMDVCVVLTNFPNLETARQIGTLLVERQLAACVNLLGEGESIYSWEGKICRECEIPALIKTRRALLPDLEKEFGVQHPYEVPEFLVLNVDHGAPAYLEWLAYSTMDKKSR